LQRKIHELSSEDVPAAFSLTRSFAKLVERILSGISSERLEFDLLFFENATRADGPWRPLADVAHVRPSTFKLPYFQTAVFGEQPPVGSLLAAANEITCDNLPEMLDAHPTLRMCYSFVRTKVDPRTFTSACRAALGKHVPLADLLWHYEEVAGHSGSPASHAELDQAIDTRLIAGETLSGAIGTDNFAKLLERLLLLRKMQVPFWTHLMPIADALLAELKRKRLALIRTKGGGSPCSLQSLAAAAVAECPQAARVVPQVVMESLPVEPSLSVAVLGDASASMQVCVEASCICGAMMSAVFEAELVFFNSTAFRSSRHAMPTTVEEVLAVTEEVRASGTTSPAAALAEFYVAKKVVDVFIVVTDEEENSKWQAGRAVHKYGMPGLSFAELFARYCSEVHAGARCVFVSFLGKMDNGDGPMVKALKQQGIEVSHVKYDQHRPDLSKFDTLLGSVLIEASKALYAQAVHQGSRKGFVANDSAELHAKAALAIAVEEVGAVERGVREAAARSVAQLEAGMQAMYTGMPPAPGRTGMAPLPGGIARTQSV